MGGIIRIFITALNKAGVSLTQGCGLNLVSNSAAHSLLVGCRENGKSKIRKTHVLRQSSIGKAKAMHTSKIKQGINSLLPMGRQMFCNPQDSRAPSLLMVTGENKCQISESPFLFVLPSALYAEHDAI